MTTDNTTCDAQAEACVCRQDPDHDGAHVCPCGGSWTGTYGGADFDVISWPGTNPEFILGTSA